MQTNRATPTKVDQNFNMICFLNRDWDEAWGGHLELWDKNLTQCEAKIAPIFNRATGTNTYRDHPIRWNALETVAVTLPRCLLLSDRRPRSENYEGWRNFVDWMPTTEDERSRPQRESQPQVFRFEGKI